MTAENPPTMSTTPPAVPARLGRPSSSLRAQIILLLCFAMGPTAVLGIWQALAAYNRQSQEIEQALARDAAVALRAQEEIVAGAERVLNAIAQQEAIQKRIAPECLQSMDNTIRDMPAYAGMMLLDREGRQVCWRLPERAGDDYTDRAWRNEIADGQTFTVSELLTGRYTQRRLLVTAVPVKDETGAFNGTLSLGIDVEKLGAINDPLQEAPDLAVLLDRNGAPIVPLEAADATGARLPATLPTYAPNVGDAHVFSAASRDGIDRIYAMTPVVKGNLYILYGQPKSRLYAAANRDLGLRIGLPMGIWLLAIITIWVGLERLVIRWVGYFRRAAADYAQGRYDVPAEDVKDAPSEIRELGEALTTMAARAHEREVDLHETVKQRDILIREVHHRVKNNLQIIMSLLNLQSRRITDPAQLAVFEETKNRISALSLLHQTLYQTNNLEFINLNAFVTDLCQQMLRAAWRGDSSAVQFKIDIPDIIVRTEMATPLTLLLTEAVTNSLKHAFKRRGVGLIEISLTQGENSTTLVIKDNGAGVPSDGPQKGSIGTALINGFVRQLGGTLETVSDDEGTTVTMQFPYVAMERWSLEGGKRPPEEPKP